MLHNLGRGLPAHINPALDQFNRQHLQPLDGITGAAPVIIANRGQNIGPRPVPSGGHIRIQWIKLQP